MLLSSLFFFVLLCLISISNLSLIKSALPNAGGSLVYPRVGLGCSPNMFGGWTTCGYPMVINITSPPELAGSIAYGGNAGDPHLLNSLADANGNINIRLLPYTASNLASPTDKNGNPYAGNGIVHNKGSTVEIPLTQLSPAPLIIVRAGISNGFPPVLNVPDAAAGPVGVNSGVSTIYLSPTDGAILYNYLANNNSAAPVYMSIAAPGYSSPQTRQALQQVMSGFTYPAGNLQQITNPHLSVVNAVNDPNYDPCNSSYPVVWCERGIIKYITLGNPLLATGPLNDAGFTYLATNGLIVYIDGGSPLNGAFPPSLCNNPSAVTLFWIHSNSPFSSFPDCLGIIPSLKIVEITGADFKGGPVPSTISQTSAVYFQMQANMGGIIPADWSSTSSTLAFLDLSGNQMTGTIPNFGNFPLLTTIKLDGNSFNNPANPMNPSILDNIPGLQWFSCIQCGIYSTSLPTFTNSQNNLIHIGLSFNNIGGSIPSSWTTTMLTQLQFLAINNNNLQAGNWAPLYSLTLTSLDLSYNNISQPSPSIGWQSFLSSIVSPTIVTFKMAHNALFGLDTRTVLSTKSSSIFVSLISLDVSYNQITGPPPDLFTAVLLQQANFKGNPFVYSLPQGQPQIYQSFFDFSSMPGLVNNNKGNLPTWLTISTTSSALINGTNYLCGAIVSNIPANPTMVFNLDRSYYGYQGCVCSLGTYGNIPNCVTIPSISGSIPSPSLNPLVQLPLSVTRIQSPSYSFTDNWYGNQRGLTGLDTVWNVDLSSLIVSSTSSSSSSSSSYVSTNYSTIQYQSYTFSPSSSFYSLPNGYDIIRSTNIIFLFDLTQFNQPSDIIDIFQSSNSISPLYSSSGSSAQINQFTPLTLSACKLMFDPSTVSIVSLFGSIAMWEVSIVGPTASIEFRSRATGGQHFTAIYSGSSQCPSGYVINPLYNPYNYMNDSPCNIIQIEYYVSTGLLYAIYAISAAFSIIMLITMAIVFSYRTTAVIRASSFKFTIVTLISLTWMAATSSLYAIVPSNPPTSNMICNARLWCSCLSLMTILGILVAKSMRVSVIFGSKVLMQIKNVTDGYVASIAGTFVIIEIIMLIIFNAMGMTKANLVSNGNNNEVVWSCSTYNGFAPWMGVNIGIFAMVMIAGAIVAFKTKSVPSAFNESSHILFTLQILLFMLIILAPLDWALVSNSPEASIVIQGGGQLILTIFIWASNFIPKMYYIATGRADDRSMLFQSVGTKISVSGASASSSGMVSKKSRRSGDGNSSATGGGNSSNGDMQMTENQHTNDNHNNNIEDSNGDTNGDRDRDRLKNSV